MRTVGALLLLVFCNLPLRANTPDPLACRNNVAALDGAKQQLQIDKKQHLGDPVESGMLTQYFRHALPVCPSGGSYTIGPIGQEPTCSIAAHSPEAVLEFISRQRQPSFPWAVFTKRFVLLGVPVLVAYFAIRRLRPLRRRPR